MSISIFVWKLHNCQKPVIRRYLYEKQLKEYNERIEKEIAEKKAAYQSGQAYRNGSDDVIDVNYVEKDENE